MTDFQKIREMVFALIEGESIDNYRFMYDVWDDVYIFENKDTGEGFKVYHEFLNDTIGLHKMIEFHKKVKEYMDGANIK